MDNPKENENAGVSAAMRDEQVAQALADSDFLERYIFGNETLCNEVIARYLDELSGASSVPVVRGFAALHPLPRPRTLQEAKHIVDNT